MPSGPGKYDKWCEELLLELQASAVIVVVIDGVLGNGFSVNSTNPVITKLLAGTLRNVADEIERSL